MTGETFVTDNISTFSQTLPVDHSGQFVLSRVTDFIKKKIVFKCLLEILWCQQVFILKVPEIILMEFAKIFPPISLSDTGVKNCIL